MRAYEKRGGVENYSGTYNKTIITEAHVQEALGVSDYMRDPSSSYRKYYRGHYETLTRTHGTPTREGA